MSRIKRAVVPQPKSLRKTQDAEPSQNVFWKYLLRMPMPLAERLRESAAKNENSLGGEILEALEFYLDTHANGRLLRSARDNRRTLNAELLTAVDYYLSTRNHHEGATH